MSRRIRPGEVETKALPTDERGFLSREDVGSNGKRQPSRVGSDCRKLPSVTRGSRSSFIDPRPALEKEFEAARVQLRQAHGPSRSLLGAFRLFVAERRLHYAMVTKPLRSAHW